MLYGVRLNPGMMAHRPLSMLVLICQTGLNFSAFDNSSIITHVLNMEGVG